MPENQTADEPLHPAVAAAPASDWTLPAEQPRQRPADSHQPALIARDPHAR